MMDQGTKSGADLDEEIYDVLGIGFGPANLALAIAMEESERPLRHLFLESKPSFVWHPNMLIKDSMLQVTVLKDLIMIENPCSRFTFLNYLKQKDRLFEFLNLRTLFPTRLEFNDYLTWAAEQLNHSVHYGRVVSRVEPVSAGGDATAEQPELLRVIARDLATGEEVSYLTRHLVLAAGGQPSVPEGIDLASTRKVIHPAYFLDRIQEFPDPEAAYRFVVVGSGQSAGELFEYLMDNYPNAEVTAAVRRFSYKPVDESDFTNRIFFPEWTDYYNSLSGPNRRSLFESLKDLNYAAMDHPLIRRIYEKLYRQKVEGHERCKFVPFQQLETVEETENGLRLGFRNLMEGTTNIMEADGLVACTGFDWPKEHPLLDALASSFKRDDLGGYNVKRDYAIETQQGFRPKVYLQGYCEDTHGITETVLSLLPVRAREILTSIHEALDTAEN